MMDFSSPKQLRFSESGQTLIEAIVVTLVVVIIATGLVISSTASLRNSDATRLRSRATKHAQEGLETVRFMRNQGWNTFSTYSGLYCLDEAKTLSVTSGSCDTNIDGTFTRSVTFTWNDPRMEVAVSVAWFDGQSRSVDLTSYFTDWR